MKTQARGWLPATLLATLMSFTALAQAQEKASAPVEPSATEQRAPAEQAVTAPQSPVAEQEAQGFSQEEVLAKADAFFGETTQGLAKAVEKVFADQGEPNAIITGEEASAAIGIGARYGRGELQTVTGATLPVFWQGPSVGFDFGANASKVFTLLYKLDDVESLFQRFPGVEGSLYVVAGVGVNYQRSGDITIAPIRTGVGLRGGANVGYIHYTKEKSWNPF